MNLGMVAYSRAPQSSGSGFSVAEGPPVPAPPPRSLDRAGAVLQTRHLGPAAALIRTEVPSLLAQLQGTAWLRPSLLYGSGLRLMSCGRLRVQDPDLGRRERTVHHDLHRRSQPQRPRCPQPAGPGMSRRPPPFVALSGRPSQANPLPQPAMALRISWDSRQFRLRGRRAAAGAILFPLVCILDRVTSRRASCSSSRSRRRQRRFLTRREGRRLNTTSVHGMVPARAPCSPRAPPNIRVNLAVRPVTAPAKRARAAPVQPAGYS